MVADTRLHEPIDYEHLRREALAQLEVLSSDHWTDYNTHDPGITIMEILCFALTELGLRSNLSINDLLADCLNKDETGFYPSHHILPNRALTPEDYRKLLLNVDHVKNAWLKEIEGHHSPLSLNATQEKLLLMSRLETPYFVHCRRYVREVSANTEGTEAVQALDQLLNSLFVDREVLLTRIDLHGIFSAFAALTSLTLHLDDGSSLGITGADRLTVTGANPRAQIEAFYKGQLPQEVETTFSRTVGEDEEKKVKRLIKALDIRDLDLLAYDFGGLFDHCPHLASVTFRFASTHLVDGEVEADHLRVSKDVNGALCFASHDEERVVCRGYYRVDVELEDGFPRSQVNPKLEEIRAVLNRNRNLCEFFPVVNLVRDEYVCVCFDIELAPHADVEEVMSEVVYRLDRFISPDIHFYSLRQMKERRHPDTGAPYAIEEIFNGPLLSSGFIDDAELRAAIPKTELRASDLIREMMDVPLVVAVNKMLMSSFHPDGQGRLIPVAENQEWVLPLDPTRSSKLLIHYRSGEMRYQSKFTAHKGNLPYTVYPERLLNNIKVLRAGNSPVPFTPAALREVPPRGRSFDLAAYDTLRNHFPMNYALKEGELVDSAPAERKAKVMQLRAFLLFFDQLLANAFKQLSKLGDLLSFHHLDQTYFTQLTELGESLEALLSVSPEAYLARVQSLTESEQRFDQRRNRFLDHLLARFGEEFKDYYALAEHMYGDEAHEHLIEDKERICRHIVPWSSQRALAEDLLWSARTPLNLSGLEYRMRLFLGMAVREGQGRGSRVALNQSNLTFLEDVNGGGVSRYRLAISNVHGKLLVSEAFSDPTTRDRATTDLLAQFQAGWQAIEDGVTETVAAAWDAGVDPALDAGQRVARIEAILTAQPVFSHVSDDRRGEVVGTVIKIITSGQTPPHQRRMTLRAFLSRVEKEPGRSGLFNKRLTKCAGAGGPAFRVETVQGNNQWTFHVTLERPSDPAIVLNSSRAFRSEEGAQAALGEVADFLLTFHFIDKMFLFEHSLLLLDNSIPEQVLPICRDSGGETLATVDPYSFRLTLVLPGETEMLANMKFRLYLEKAIREATPSHLIPKICWVSHEQIVEFERAIRAWRDARLVRPVDGQAAVALRQARGHLIRSLTDLRSVYDPATLGSSLCADGQDDTGALVLGYTKLGPLENGD